MMASKYAKLFIPVLFALSVVPLIALLTALPFMLLWNMAFVPAVTIAKPIGFVHAFFLSMFFSMFIVGRHSGKPSE